MFSSYVPVSRRPWLRGWGHPSAPLELCLCLLCHLGCLLVMWEARGVLCPPSSPDQNPTRQAEERWGRACPCLGWASFGPRC